MKAIVCGGRKFDNYDFLEHALNEISNEVGGITLIANGACEGADKQSSEWAKRHGIHFVEVPALWDYHGKAAGPKRNRAMIEIIDPDIVVAFPGGFGTADMVERGRKHGLDVIDLRNADVKQDKTPTLPDDSLMKEAIERLKVENAANMPIANQPWHIPYEPTKWISPIDTINTDLVDGIYENFKRSQAMLNQDK